MPRHHRPGLRPARRARAAALGLLLAVGVPAAASAQHGAEKRIGPDTSQHVPASNAKRGHWKKGKHGPFGVLKMADELGLSDAQRARMRSILQDARAQKESLREQPADERREGFQQLHRQVREQIRNVLTPEQREQARELLRARRQQHTERRLQHLSERLELNDSQVERIRAIKERAHEHKRELFDQMERGEELRNALRQLRERTWTDMKTVLTPAQRQQLEEMRENRERRRGRRH